MSNHLDVDRSIAEWLVAEVPDRAPDRLLEASRARVRATPQRRSLRPVRRYLAMNAYAKLGIAAAVVVVVAIVGINVAPRLNPGLTNATSPPGSPTPAPSSAAPQVVPQLPVEFTGRINCGPIARQRTMETLDVGADGTVLTRERNGAWSQTVTMTDARLEGTTHHTYEADVYRATGANIGAEVSGYTWRITNDRGTWEARSIAATFADGTTVGNPPTVLVGAGDYQGLIAIFVETANIPPCDIEVRGLIFQGAPVPEPFVAG